MNNIKMEIITNIISTLTTYELQNMKPYLITDKHEAKIIYKTLGFNKKYITKQMVESNYDDNNLLDLDIIEALEGKVQLLIHLKKERNPSFIKKCKELYTLSDSSMHCEICGFSFLEKYGNIGKGFIEGHHTLQISKLKEETIMKSSDILMVCSNCHRIMHRRYPCYTKDEIKNLLDNFESNS